MSSDLLTSVQTLLQQAASLLLYQSVLADERGQSFLNLLRTIRYAKENPTQDAECLYAYGQWFQAMAAGNQTWHDYVVTQILRDENVFSRQVQVADLDRLSPAIVAAAQHDLHTLQCIAACTGEDLSQWVQAVGTITPVVWTAPATERSCLTDIDDWATGLEALTAHYRRTGTGLLAEYRALRWQAGQLVGIAHPDPVMVESLVGYEAQKETLLKNTEFLLNGYTALHVLLYGSRGSGKSSLVKGLLHEFVDRPLRLIEVSKSELRELPTIVDRLRDLPQKFILFVDDLSFEEDEDAYKALKVVLEGNLTARPQNVVIYATSNRRHLIREFFGDRPRPRDGDEVHAWDTVQEKLSFSDRFGLTLTFEPADQKTYLAIVHHLAAQAGLSLDSDELTQQALQWATRHNGRSGRSARQFVDFLSAELAVGKESRSSKF
ncbi:ATP-binding protein [Leptolyngbya sp. FACHB-36]|uniref:ATP-binding protein n=1 Tax=Leptolyngbya sp. FACHB-36 TaxID=2692808 RepID=UPI0016815CD4|nr:ATP-binding protein [Leptolyngbya sp. FACHB-36]MBD2021119.1 ATP-binding protein [Leptolyngbya sp. FACHB-36]